MLLSLRHSNAYRLVVKLVSPPVKCTSVSHASPVASSLDCQRLSGNADIAHPPKHRQRIGREGPGSHAPAANSRGATNERLLFSANSPCNSLDKQNPKSEGLTHAHKVYADGPTAD
jgi:hypothetical protein